MVAVGRRGRKDGCEIETNPGVREKVVNDVENNEQLEWDYEWGTHSCMCFCQML